MNRFGSIHYNAIGPWLKDYFGERVIKLSLDGGFTCPNRDGRCGYGGCIFCAEDGSGRFASAADPSTGSGSRNDPVAEPVEATGIAGAIAAQQALYRFKWPEAKYIAYFQNHTNTYAPAQRLRRLWDAALSQEGVVGLAVATRPDCLPEDVMDLLSEYAEKTFLWVELGLQTANESTASYINRCYGNSVFADACLRLSERGIRFVTHLMLSLPGETREDMLASAAYAASFRPFGLKLHMLHVLKNTKLAEIYAPFDKLRERYSHATSESPDGGLKPAAESVAEPAADPVEAPSSPLPAFHLLTKNEYVGIVCDILENLPSEITIHRLTGDAPQDELIAPEWTRDKHAVLNAIQQEFKARGSWQGSALSGLQL